MDPDLELLAEISGAVEVRPSPGKGKGTFAKEFVPKGTRLISERPILRMSSNYFNDETLKKMVQNLPTTERRDFEDLHCPICQPEQALRQKVHSEPLLPERTTNWDLFARVSHQPFLLTKCLLVLE